MSYRLLDSFRCLFEGQRYLHRRSNLGDSVAVCLYEDLYALGRSKKFISRVNQRIALVNRENRRHGIAARRGDGTLGEAIPQVSTAIEEGYKVYRGPIATVEIGIEVKILAKAMIKQIDRVINDLGRQAVHFRSKGGNPVCVGIVGINHASEYLSFEGERSFPTDGSRYKHPIQEATEAERRLKEFAAPNFDEFLILKFIATNMPPLHFRWVNAKKVEHSYGASLVRISQQYEQRF